jgi:hypothetical protein
MGSAGWRLRRECVVKRPLCVGWVQVQLNVNTASIHSNRGDGFNDHLTLMITLDNYALRSINHIVFTPPTNTSTVPAHTADDTAAQIDEDNTAHAHQHHDFNHYHNAEKTLHNQLIAAVPTIYIAALHDPVITFGNTTSLELLTHLHDTYGGITEAYLDRNTDTINAQWRPPTSIEVLFMHIEDGVTFAMAGDNPKSVPVILQMAYNNVAKTGRFDMTCHECRNMPPADKSWEVFNTHFKTADKELRFRATTGSSGCHGAAHMTTNAGTSLSAVMQAKLLAAEDALAVALAHHNIIPTTSITTAASNVFVMTPTTAAPSASSARRYCCTHTVTLNLRHNSATRHDKRNGHRDEATEVNKLGRSNNVFDGPRV